MVNIVKDKVRTSTPFEVCPKCWWPTNICDQRNCPEPAAVDAPALARPDAVKLSGVAISDMADIFPMIGEEWSTFVADVAAQGVINPIVWSADGATLIDGRNRLRAWLELGNEVESCPSRRLAKGEDEYAFIISANIARRSMNKGQLVMAAARAYPLYAERARVRKSLNGGTPGAVKFDGSEKLADARDEAAAAFRVANSYVEVARKMLVEAATDTSGRVGGLIAKVEAGEMSMNAAKTAFAALDFSPSVLDAPPPTGKFDALSKAVKNLDSADMIAAMMLMAEAVGVTVSFSGLGEFDPSRKREAAEQIRAIARAAGINIKMEAV